MAAVFSLAARARRERRCGCGGGEGLKKGPRGAGKGFEGFNKKKKDIKAKKGLKGFTKRAHGGQKGVWKKTRRKAKPRAESKKGGLKGLKRAHDDGGPRGRVRWEEKGFKDSTRVHEG